MRHFLLLPFAVGVLAGGMVARTPGRALVAPTGSLQRLPAPDLRAPIEAVDVAPITIGADPNLLVAPCAVV